MVAHKREFALLSVVALASHGFAENEPIPEPECDESKNVSIRYASSTERLYLEAGVEGERGGCVTLGQIFESRDGKAPLYAVDRSTGERSATATGTWLLTEELFVEDGIVLNVHGGDDGDADELRLLSTSDTFINLRGHGGSLSFHDTKIFAAQSDKEIDKSRTEKSFRELDSEVKVTDKKKSKHEVFSWDEEANTYDTDESDGRSYISVVSEIITDEDQDCDGRAKKTMGEARMDIVDSEIGYLGYYASESYGLTWKVRGFCKDKSNEEIFEEVNVYGNIYDSDIHHNHFGVYTYGHQQGDWRRNDMHDNTAYGFDPHDDSDFLNIHDNTVWNNGNHGIIASKRCNDVSIQGNEVYDGDNAGLFLHRSSDNAIVKNNYVHDNGDAGLAMLESFNADISDNVFENNKYGVRMSVGCADNVIRNNQIIKSTKYNAYTYLGSDDPDVVESGRSNSNTYIDNTIEGGLETIKLKESDGMIFKDNVFIDASTIRFDDSFGMVMTGNTGLGGVTLKMANDACFDDSSDSDFNPVCE